MLRIQYHRLAWIPGILLCVCRAEAEWMRHVVAEDFRTNTAVAADFTGDGKVDIIANEGPSKRDVLFVAPDWKRILIGTGGNAIHSAVLDMDGDGDPDYIAAEYSPGVLYWLERPKNPRTEPWRRHVLSTELDGIHGLAVGDIDRDGKADLVANSAQPNGSYRESIAWFRAPDWKLQILASGDAPGLSHYPGIGDANGDGRPDVAIGAKVGNWFAWWEQPAGARKTWTRHLVAEKQEGATAIVPLDVNGDGTPDLLAARGHGKGLLWYEGPRWTPHDIDTTHQFPHSLAIGDVDRNGAPDAVACSAVYDKSPMRRLAWYQNNGKGVFRTHIVSEDQAAYDIRLADMDADGDLDILVAGQESRNVVWYENRLTSRRAP